MGFFRCVLISHACFATTVWKIVPLLSIDCSFAARIWEIIASKLGVVSQKGSSILEHIQCFIDKCDKSSGGSVVLAKLCFPTFLYNIWCEGNTRIFNQKQETWEVILKETLLQIKSHITFLDLEVTPTLASSSDLPPKLSFTIGNHHNYSEARCSLLIISKDQFSIGVWRNRDGTIGWIDIVSRGDPFSEALFLIKKSL